MIDEFIKRKHNPSLVKYETELLEEVLEETYGVIVYQEQIMKIATRLANFTKSEADALRKAISKKVPEQMESLQGAVQAGVRGEQRKAGSRRQDIRRHSAVRPVRLQQVPQRGLRPRRVSDGLSQGAPLPALHGGHPHERSERYGQPDRYITECRESGVAILPPDVNESAKVVHHSG